MRQDWIEFEGQHSTKKIVPLYEIAGIVEIDAFPVELNSTDHRTEIKLCGGDYIRTIEPYEQVKQKVMDAEKVDLNDVVVEHFTDDEYVTLFVMVLAALGKSDESNNDEGLISIKNKLSKIIEKNK